MAGLACRRDSCLRVIRTGRRIVVFDVAAIAIRRQTSGEVVRVARRTGDIHVRPGKWECRLVMVERGGNPGDGRMASLALRRYTCLSMVGARGGIEIFDVAAVAIRGRAGELPVKMAIRAGQVRVCPGERVAGVFQVVKLRVVPGICVVAGLARRCKIQCSVTWVERLLKVGSVTGNACRR